MAAILFDMFGTLADPASLRSALEGETAHASKLAEAWSRHRLEISWLVSLADRYEPWPRVTEWALDAAAQECGVTLSAASRERALEQAKSPSLFPDVPRALERLARAGHTLAVFSNGTQKGLSRIVSDSGIGAHLVEVISCDEVKVYKPAAATYRHAIARMGSPLQETWLVSANPFDCAGAKAFGLNVAKVERSEAPVYGFAAPPDLTVPDLDLLAERFAKPVGWSSAEEGAQP